MIRVACVGAAWARAALCGCSGPDGGGPGPAHHRDVVYGQRRVLCANKASCLRTKACFVRKQSMLLTNKGVFCAQTRHAAYEQRRVLCANKARCLRTKACFVRKQGMLLTNKGVLCAQTRHAAYEQGRVLCANKARCLRTKACFVRKQGTPPTNKARSLCVCARAGDAEPSPTRRRSSILRAGARRGDGGPAQELLGPCRGDGAQDHEKTRTREAIARRGDGATRGRRTSIPKRHCGDGEAPAGNNFPKRASFALVGFNTQVALRRQRGAGRE